MVYFIVDMRQEMIWGTTETPREVLGQLHGDEGIVVVTLDLMVKLPFYEKMMETYITELNSQG